MIAGRHQEPSSSGRAALLTQEGEVRPVGDLENRGIAQVRLISQSQFESAVRDAVARELLELVEDLDLSANDRERLVERAIARLSGQAVDAPPRAEPKASPRSEPKSPPPSAEAPAAAPPQPRAAPVPDADFDVEAMENRIVEEVGRLVSQNWREELRTAQDSQKNQIDRLEGRIDSLMKALDQIERLMDQQPAVPSGEAVSSFIDSNALGGIKNELLEQLFEANLALRELEAGEGSS